MRALPAAEGNPPLVIVVDVGHVIELYADFSRFGKAYMSFPNARSHRVALARRSPPNPETGPLRP